jgi:ABC-type multidrug transport system fused ATPase/permease subunit
MSDNFDTHAGNENDDQNPNQKLLFSNPSDHTDEVLTHQSTSDENLFTSVNIPTEAISTLDSLTTTSHTTDKPQLETIKRSEEQHALINTEDEVEDIDLTQFEEKDDKVVVPSAEAPSATPATTDTPTDGTEAGPGGQSKKETLPPVSFGTLFRFATGFDYFLIFLGTLASLCNGFLLPLSSLLMGEVLNHMQDDFQSVINDICFLFTSMGIISLVAGSFQTFCMTLSAERQGRALREAYLKALFRQEMTFHDTAPSGKDVASKITEFTQTVQNGLADKLGSLISAFASFVFALVLAFTKGWELSLVLLAPLPLLFIVIGIVMSRLSKITVEEQLAYAKANVLATETIDNIQTVKVFRFRQYLINKYNEYLQEAYKFGKSASYTRGIAFMTFLFLMFSMYSLGIAYGGLRLLARGKHTFGPNSPLYNGGLIIAIFYVLLSAMQQVGGSIQFLTAIAQARASMAQLIAVIDKDSNIDPFDFSNAYSVQLQEWTNKMKDKYGKNVNIRNLREKYQFEQTKSEKILVTSINFTGSIRFDNVSFTYPSRPQQQVLNNFSFEFSSHKTYGVVGSSGCGKSTLVQLIQRFYDPDSGSVQVEIYDGVNPADPQAKTIISLGNCPTKWVDLKDIFVGPWRKYCCGLVTQEPPLMPGSIADNIRFGNPHASTGDIVTAALLSHSHDFIMKKDENYNCYLSSGSLSGGQSQRIAIARVALMRPSALLLDEYTSAFDYKTESIVSSNITSLRYKSPEDEHNQNSTAIGTPHIKLMMIIAHRLVTVRHCDYILGMKDGKLCEVGDHSTLLRDHSDGIYSQMYHAHPDPTLTGALSPIASHHSADLQLSLRERAQCLINDHHIHIRPSNFIRTTDKYLVEQKASTEATRSAREFRFSKLIFHIFANHPLLMLLVLISIAIGGASFPGFSWIFGHALKALYEPNIEKLKADVKRYALYFIYFALAAGLNIFFTYAVLGVVSEKVVLYFRSKLFTNIVQQELAFFDQEENSTGVLTTKLAKDTSQIRTFITQFFQQCLSFIAQLIITFCMSYTISPKMTWIMCLIFPLTVLSSYLHFRFVRGFAGAQKEHLENAGVIAVTSMKNIRVLASFNVENWTWVQFSNLNDDALWTGMLSGLYGGFGFGLSQFCFYFASALTYWFGGKLVIDGTLMFNEFFQVSQSMRFASQQFSMILSQMSSLDAINAAISDMYQLMDRETLDEAYLVNNVMKSKEARQDLNFSPITRGHVQFKNVKFHYPTNRALQILKGISLSTETKSDRKDKTYLISLVGGSGNGKSTIMNLLLQFYQSIQPGANQRLAVTKRSEYYQFLRRNHPNLLSSQPETVTQSEEGLKQPLLQDDYNNDQNALLFSQTINSDQTAIPINLNIDDDNVTSPEEEFQIKRLDDMNPAERAAYAKEKSRDFETGGQFRDPALSGQIFIDGYDINTIPLNELYKRVSFVPQQPQIFNTTVFENIRCHDESISLEQVIEAAKKAQIDDIISRLPKKYETIIDSKKLSTGQKQRICIARAIVRDPALLLLDEAASGLDNINSKKVHKALEVAMHNKVTISIAHRLETIASADLICVLDRGVIVEQGTHESLLQQSEERLKQGLPQGIYANFLDSTISQ